ncbi:uncharacterized protein B0P05DRAFT_118886 [Gilbertella persicaria]|uniref:uncharacterized protein n=1 Tax=Gilbertella persicaria TaxID=101096 RepID=UPI00221EEE6E|nr:uncharacterized protein B0P05DRAFT_118886 [Gilbertella persicaria]KAI8077956.1 hypothetical protein B0P05DRAFT_118886 [Gilbertella persicaria]
MLPQEVRMDTNHMLLTKSLGSYTNYAPAYGGGYTSTGRYGYVGRYNPVFPYFFIMPPFLFLGYHTAYHRYNSETGYYYAPQLTEQGSSTQNVIINGTANSGKDENYHYTFNISTNNQFPMVDHAFFSTSDQSAPISDFVYRLQFTQLVEFEDTNQNGFYDPNEQIYSVSSLRNLAWQPFQVSNITVPNNATQFYLQTSTFANVTYNNTSPFFTVRITYRTSNIQLNNTAPIVMQPNSLEYDFAIEGFPNTRPNARLAVAQLVSTPSDVPINFDVNMTTPVDVANQIKTNMTYGLSIGDYTEGRLEYQNTVNISDVSTISNDLNPQTLASIPTYTEDDWIWGSNASAANRNNKLLFVTMPFNGSGSASFSGFGFLDTDVMSAMAASAGHRLVQSSAHLLLVLSVAAYLFL